MCLRSSHDARAGSYLESAFAVLTVFVAIFACSSPRGKDRRSFPQQSEASAVDLRTLTTTDCGTTYTYDTRVRAQHLPDSPGLWGVYIQADRYR